MTQSTTHSASRPPLPSPKERRKLREAKSMSEKEVAAALGVTKATVRAWEMGRSDPRGRRREAYVKLLGYAGPDPDAPAAQPAAQSAATAAMAATAATAEEAGAAPEPEPSATGTRTATGTGTASEVTGGPVEAAPETIAARPELETATATATETETETGAGVHREGKTAARSIGLKIPEKSRQPHSTTRPAPAEAFDALYGHAAPSLVRQSYLLTGRQRLSHESVERAFHLAWQHWPEVARDRDPVGWVRAAAYEFAMSPWQRLRPAHRNADAPPLDPERRALLDALLELPPAYRRTLILYDGLGLDLPETAAETEASTPAAASRVLHARESIAGRLPGLDTPEALHQQLIALADACPTPQPAPAQSVREGSERRVWFWTRTALTVTALIVSATGFTLATAPRQYEPAVAPGQRVEGVPAHAGPQPLTERGRKLRDRLFSEPAHGPERLVPRIP
ncbi:sigma factor-like helix-turn-helix DNA-binding protein [Streptomyces katsurahamanus]|uniref:Helix-turn-helix domain-containing protein n=1 Tax=Streptomyces katsurahamanus TaxID=2577098 RepID=A0ABW9NRB8_9ACTN|nr:sigma factor-like helix-turn-helix DNA-binding protein [Streptomyces katsurahamanus]MQS35837.1 helix-turn-helix domain-containing protein [Streptomyces katsurahamanus]